MAFAEPILLCDVSKGLELINEDSLPKSQIEMILSACDKVSPNNANVLLLHGLLARKNKQYPAAIAWFEKARILAPQNQSISLELAATYEWAKQLPKAAELYQFILQKNPQNRAALLGQARIFRLQFQFSQATTIYQNLLKNGPHDVDALNGLGWVRLAEKDWLAASNLFNETLKIQPENMEALLAINKIKQTEFGQSQLCNVRKGLILLNQEHPVLSQVKDILTLCAQNRINNNETQLLHGLVARKEAQSSQNYHEAIDWLTLAAKTAANNDTIPALELATTYEWAKRPSDAIVIYQTILNREPGNRAALLGQARILRIESKFLAASEIYRQLLLKNPKDIDALNGLGWLKLAEKDFQAATNYFRNTLAIQSINKEALIALGQIKAAQVAYAMRFTSVAAVSSCKAMAGLRLLNEKNPLLAEIEKILVQCKQEKIEDAEVALLHGLLARYEERVNKHYAKAIVWLQKAMQLAEKQNFTPAMELAITYEWAMQPKKAQQIYEQVLAQDQNNRAATLGQARVMRMLANFKQAALIYQQLMNKNPKDVDALNGLGWVELAQNNFDAATRFFKEALTIQPLNADALLALKKIAEAKLHPPSKSLPPSLCDADLGLMLLNKDPKNPPLVQIQKILACCDKNTANNTSNLMLHGLLARFFAQRTGDYKDAIAWLKLATQTAEQGKNMAALELAITYEWADQSVKALFVYDGILFNNPAERPALLGKARVLRSLYKIKSSLAIYQQILRTSPKDIEALNGLGEVYLTNYEFDKAREVLTKVILLNPNNKQTAADLKILNNATKNILGYTQGHYSVPPNTSEGNNLYYFRNINATDGITAYATHNSKQIASSFGAGTALLPNNSLLLGYQHIIPGKYSWQASYDARQHNSLPFEHRGYGALNVFVNKRLECFGALRVGSPSPWKTQLLVSGATVYTPFPVNITATGFWAFQEIGGFNTSYALDFSKEYNNRVFYNFGPSYLIQQRSWEVHARVILPIFINQALTAEGSHYFFNKSTFITAGWRVYWA
jgi:tetratricopeptide (TPR) repeat protein